MDFKTKFNLESNPFRITPAASSEELIWVGFPEIKSKIERRIIRTIKIPNSSLVLNWGEYGSGKTHAARYFNKKSVLKDISGGRPSPYSMVFSLPKGKEPVYDIYISIIDELRIKEIRTFFNDKETIDIEGVINNIGNNTQIQSVLKTIFNDDVSEDLVKSYLYGNINAKELKSLNDYGIYRKLNNDTDYTKLISGLFNSLTHEKIIFSSVIMWIDEFEDIAVLSNSNIDKANNFLREVLDNTPNNLLIFINLTQTALMGAEDLGEYIYESVRTRIKEKNNFEIPSRQSFDLYLKEILKYYQVSDKGDYFPFSEDTIEYLLDKLEDKSIRRFNDAFSLLLEIADLDKAVIPISKNFLEENEKDIIWDLI